METKTPWWKSRHLLTLVAIKTALKLGLLGWLWLT
jgi:hypothetical protein